MNQEEVVNKIKEEELKIHLSLLPQVILARYSILAIISATCAGFLAIGTLGGIFSLSNRLIKFLLSSYLILMLLSLLVYLIELRRGERSLINRICNIVGISKEERDQLDIGKSVFDKIWGYLPYIIYFIFLILSVIVIIFIFRSY